MRTITYEEEFAVINPNDESILKKNDEPISMRVGIKDLLSILIEFDHTNYGIHGTLKGFVSFGKINLLLTKMEVQILKKEVIFGVDAKKKAKPKILATFELIDGGPYKNETIPFRFFLEPYNLTPSYIDVAGNFSVRYYINLIIKDQKNNRYFKQKEIFLYRLFLKTNKYSNNTLNNNVLDNEFIDVGNLKDFITEPFDYGDYFSVFNEVDEDEEKNKEKIDSNEVEPDEFIYKSNLTGFVKEKEKDFNEYANDNNNAQEDLTEKYIREVNIMRRKEQEDLSLKYMKGYDIMKSKKKTDNNNQVNSPFFNNRITNRNAIDDINNNNINNNMDNINDVNNVNNDNNINKININDIFGEDNNKIINQNIPTDNNTKKDKKKKKKNDKKSSSATKENEKKTKANQVINIKEKNKYKNNDILINDYFNTDNYIIYENSYQNIFDDKLKQSRIKNNKIEKKNEDEDEKQKEDIFAFTNNDEKDNNMINTNNIPITNSINDYNLFYPDEPFSNTLIMSNFPTNYNNIGQSGNFRQNLMGQRIKKK